MGVDDRLVWATSA